MISSCFTRQSFQNVHQPWWTVYNDFYPVATEVTSNLLSLAWRLRLHPIVGSNDPKPDPIYASLRLAFHPKCALSARKCIAQYRLKFQIIHCQFFFWIRPCVRFIIFILKQCDSYKIGSSFQNVSIVSAFTTALGRLFRSILLPNSVGCSGVYYRTR